MLHVPLMSFIPRKQFDNFIRDFVAVRWKACSTLFGFDAVNVALAVVLVKIVNLWNGNSI